MKLKSAFTLAELMIFFLVVTVLLSIMFAAIKPKKALDDKNVKFKYASAYDALNLAVYDLMEKDETNPFVINDGDMSTPIPNKAFKKLCTGLSSYINNEDEKCNINPISSNVAYMQNESFDFRTLTPHITALNGMKFYISQLLMDDKMPNTSRSYYSEENPDLLLSFFMVYVDINGNDFPQRPHSIIAQAKKAHPDVFAFAVIPTGEAIPIGIAEYNVKYFSARASYNEGGSVFYSPFYSFRQAKHAAWDWYKIGNPNIKFKDKISFTYNDFIKEILQRKSSQLYKFNSDGTYPESYDTPIFQKCNPPAGTTLDYYDMCSITVDTPNFGSTR